MKILINKKRDIWKIRCPYCKKIVKAYRSGESPNPSDRSFYYHFHCPNPKCGKKVMFDEV